MKRGFLTSKLNLGLVALLLLGIGYLGLMLSLGTSSPFLVVRGTSMEPTFHSGDLLLSRGASPIDIRVGDLIAFSVPDDVRQRLKMPPTAVHRVTGIEGEGGRLTFVTRGDNSDVDPFKVPASAVRGVVLKNLGPIAWPMLLLTNRGVLLYLGLPVLAFVVVVLVALWWTPGAGRETPAPGLTAPAEASAGEIEGTLDRLVAAIAEYGAHLRSHTEVIKNLAGSSEELRHASHQQNQVLVGLAALVREMEDQAMQKQQLALVTDFSDSDQDGAEWEGEEFVQ